LLDKLKKMEKDGRIVRYWTTLYELQLLLNIEEWKRIVIKFDETENVGEDSMVAYWKVLFRHYSGGTEEYHKDLNKTNRCPGRN
jgi:hypothetical protein